MPYERWKSDQGRRRSRNRPRPRKNAKRSEEHTSELQSPCNLVCRLLLEKKKQKRWECPQLIRSSSLIRTASTALSHASHLFRPALAYCDVSCVRPSAMTPSPAGAHTCPG